MFATFFQQLSELRDVNPDAAEFIDHTIQILHQRDVKKRPSDAATALAAQMTWRRVKAAKMTG